MGYQDDYVMRTISDLVRAIARLMLDKDDTDCGLPGDEEKYTPLGRTYRQLRDLMNAGNINETENFFSDQLDPPDLDCLKIALALYTYLSQSNSNILYRANYLREEIVDSINSVCTEYGISGPEYFVDTTMV